jgi:hypothetical protein
VIFAKYQAYLDRQNKSKDGNNIESEENILTNKTPNRFAGLNHPWKLVATPTFIFFAFVLPAWGLFPQNNSNRGLVFIYRPDS